MSCPCPDGPTKWIRRRLSKPIQSATDRSTRSSPTSRGRRPGRHHSGPVRGLPGLGGPGALAARRHGLQVAPDLLVRRDRSMDTGAVHPEPQSRHPGAGADADRYCGSGERSDDVAEQLELSPGPGDRRAIVAALASWVSFSCSFKDEAPTNERAPPRRVHSDAASSPRYPVARRSLAAEGQFWLLTGCPNGLLTRNFVLALVHSACAWQGDGSSWP